MYVYVHVWRAAPEIQLFSPLSCSNDTIQTLTRELLVPYINKAKSVCLMRELTEACICTLLVLVEDWGSC